MRCRILICFWLSRFVMNYKIRTNQKKYQESKNKKTILNPWSNLSQTCCCFCTATRSLRILQVCAHLALTWEENIGNNSLGFSHRILTVAFWLAKVCWWLTARKPNSVIFHCVYLPSFINSLPTFVNSNLASGTMKCRFCFFVQMLQLRVRQTRRRVSKTLLSSSVSSLKMMQCPWQAWLSCYHWPASPFPSCYIICSFFNLLFVSRCGLALRQAGKQRDLGSNLLWLSFLFKSCGLWTPSCDFVPHN